LPFEPNFWPTTICPRWFDPPTPEIEVGPSRAAEVRAAATTARAATMVERLSPSAHRGAGGRPGPIRAFPKTPSNRRRPGNCALHAVWRKDPGRPNPFPRGKIPFSEAARWPRGQPLGRAVVKLPPVRLTSTVPTLAGPLRLLPRRRSDRPQSPAHHRREVSVPIASAHHPLLLLARETRPMTGAALEAPRKARRRVHPCRHDPALEEQTAARGAVEREAGPPREAGGQRGVTSMPSTTKAAAKPAP